MTRYLELNDEHRIRNRIRERREVLGRTLTAVAEEVELNKGELSAIETGRRVPSPVELARLASALGAEPEELYPIVEAPAGEELVAVIPEPPVANGPARRRSGTETQRAVILELLRERGAAGVTPLDALEVAGSFRLSGRILELRDQGYNIETKLTTTPGGARVARYVLRETTER